MSDTKKRLDDLRSMLDNEKPKQKSGPKPKTKLNSKQELFLQHYMANGCNGKAAAISAGYSEIQAASKASQILQEPLVKAELDKMKSEVRTKLEIDRDWLIEQYMQIINSAQINGNDGEGTVHDRTAWLNTLKAISKMLALDEPTKIDVTSNGNTLNINYIIPEEIEEQEDND